MKIDKSKLRYGTWYEDRENNVIPDDSNEVGYTPNDAMDVICAMVQSGDYTFEEAVCIWVNACERCMNVLTYKYTNGKDGYPEHSEEWEKCNTCCDFCEETDNEK